MPQHDEQAIEQSIQSAGATAPRLTPADIDGKIASEFTFRASDAANNLNAAHTAGLTCLTICILTLKNGFTVVGTSACASPENYNADIGGKIARDNARSQIWQLEGYLLRSALASQPDIYPDRVRAHAEQATAEKPNPDQAE